jgi:hypothetical protein
MYNCVVVLQITFTTGFVIKRLNIMRGMKVLESNGSTTRAIGLLDSFVKKTKDVWN